MTQPVVPHPSGELDRHFTRAVIGGVVGAVAGGAAWAVIVRVTGYELGYAAWAIGGLVGYLMARLSPARGSAAGMVAAGIAAVGLLLGKGLIVTVGMNDSLISEIKSDPEWMAEVVAADLYSREAYPDSIQMAINSLAINDTISDALYAKMLSAAGSEAETMSDEDRHSLAEARASAVLSDYGIVDRLQSSVTLWDLLWVGLAVTTAYKMLAGRPEQDIEEEPAPESG